MVEKRFQSKEIESWETLAESLHFRTSGRTARNRILKAALTEIISTFDQLDVKKSGLPTRRLINLYEKFGHGGYGVLLTGNIIVDPWHLESPGNVIIAKEADTEERRQLLKQYAATAKADGALAVVQLSHAGRQTPFLVNSTPFSASDVQLKIEMAGNKFGKPIPLSVEQIKTEVIDRFVFATKQVKAAGFDGIELHGAHGYLLAQFLSPRTNKRNDRYGGSIQNRVRIIEEIYQAIRAEIPAETGFIIGIKINSVEFQDDSNGIEDVVQIAQMLDKTGFDFLELSGGTYEGFKFFHEKESTRKREAFFSEFASVIKPHVENAKVYLTGGFRTVTGMVRAVREKETDGIGVGRPTSSEPDFPKKILTGQITGVPYSHVERNNIATANVCFTEMSQAGATSYEESGHDPSFGISDFSSQKVIDDYLPALYNFLADIIIKRKRNQILANPFEYQSPKPGVSTNSTVLNVDRAHSTNEGTQA